MLKNLDNSKETWVITARVIKKWEVHRRTPPFPVWKLSMMLLDEEVCVMDITIIYINFLCVRIKNVTQLTLC